MNIIEELELELAANKLVEGTNLNWWETRYTLTAIPSKS